MKKFFVPSSFGKGAETVKFTPIQGNLSGPKTNQLKATKSPVTTTKKKKKRQIKKGAKLEKDSKQNVASIKIATRSSKFKTGRIEKKTKKSEKNSQLKQITAALAKAAQDAIPTLNAKKKHSKTGLNLLQEKLNAQLKGGKFRFLNEQLYTMDSKQAETLFEQDRAAFDSYHAGYRHQVEKWPLNPLDRIIKMIRKLPKALEIADFGCGEGRLAKSVPNKVYSLDLVSLRDDIIACNMDSTPLQSESIDVAVYCLSLMGTNLKDYILEANRVLRPGGFMYIAEIESRFEDVNKFVNLLKSCGFALIKKDLSVKIFHFFHFKKTHNVGKVALIPNFSLKPCLYKKR